MATPISVSDQGFKLPVSLASISTATVFTDSGGSAILVNIPALISDVEFSKSAKNQPFDLKAWGRFDTTGASSTFQPLIRVGNSATDGTNAPFITPTALGAAATTGSWLLEAEVMWDTTSLVINGIYWGWIKGTAVTQAIVTAAVSLTASNFSGASPNGLNFVVSAAFGVSNSGNIAYLDGFDADWV